MKIDRSFPVQILLSLLALACLGSYPLMRYGGTEIINAVVAGALLATVNVLIGYAAIEYSFGKSTTTFFKYVLGGMGIRFAMMAAVLVVLIKVYDLHAGALVGSMGVCYFVFLILEVVFIQKKISIKQGS